MPSSLLQHAASLLFLLTVLLVAAGMGRLLLHKTCPKVFSIGENLVFAAGIGFGLLSYSIFSLGVFQLLYPSTIYGIVLLACILSLAGWITTQKQAPVEFDFKIELSLLDKGLFILLTILLCFSLLFLLTPSIGNDELTYHLAVPKLYLDHHGFYFIPGNIFSNYPLNTEMLFLPALMLQGDVFAKIIHFSMAMLVLTGMWHFSRHHLPEIASPALGLLVFFSIPSVFITSHMAYNDMAMAFYSFLAFYGFMNWFENQEKAWLVLCGVFTGLAAATKYSGLLLPLLGCLGVLYASRRNQEKPGQAIIYIAIYWFGATLAASPIYIKTWFMTGNPLYPFFYDIFGGLGWSKEQARHYGYFLHSLGMGRNFSDYIMLPWNLSINARMHSSAFDGILGPVFILTLPFAVGIKKVPTVIKISLIYCLFFFMFWASSAQQVRYLIPIFPVLAIITTYVLYKYRKAPKPMSVLLIILIAGSIIFNTYHISREFRTIRPDRFVFGRENRGTFLTRLIPSYPMFQHINTHLPEKTKVFFIYMRNLGYLCQRPYYSDSMFESYTIEKILERSRTPEKVLEELKEMGFTHILYDIHYTAGDLSTFSSEAQSLFRIFQIKYLKLIKKDKERFYLYEMPAG